MDAARSISSAVRESRGWATPEACHVAGARSTDPGPRRPARRVEALAAVVVLVVSLAVLAGPARATTTRVAAGADEVACPATLDGVPLSLDPEFAGTPRALANDEGVLVRYSLLCPYARRNGTEVAALTLAWSRYAADDLDCSAVAITSEPAGDGRIEGLVDHPSLSARVTYGAASEDLLPAVEEAATELLTRVPDDTYPCVGGAATDVDASLAPSSSTGSSGTPLLLALALLALTAGVVLAVAMVARRSRRRSRDRAAAVQTPAPGAPSVGDLAAALRAKRLGAAAGETGAPAPPLGAPVVPGPVADERRSVLAARQRAAAERDAVELLLLEARADLAMHREHADAVRRLAASVASDGEHREFLSSYAGTMALAVAATNLVSTSARRAAALAGDRGTGGTADLGAPASALATLHERVIAAAETGLGDSRYWLWQDRRLAVVEALAAVGDAVPRLVAVQARLAAHVGGLAEHHRRLGAEVDRLDEALAEIDRRAAPSAAGSPLEGAGV